jgi:hypothetical protein
MILKFGDGVIDVSEWEKLKSNISNSTGKEIEKFSFHIKIIGKNNVDKFLEKLKDKKENIFSIDENGNILKIYKVNNYPYSYSGSYQDERTIYNFSIESEEIEELKIQKLILSGKEFFPYDYSETFDDCGLMISAKIKTKINLNKFIVEKNKNEYYFPVLREGISNETKTMRFGQIFWSQNKDDYKFDLVLVEKEWDDKKLDYSHSRNINKERSLAFLINYIDELTDFLVLKNLISSEEIKSVRKKAEDKVFLKMREFCKVEDIDGY